MFILKQIRFMTGVILRAVHVHCKAVTQAVTVYDRVVFRAFYVHGKPAIRLLLSWCSMQHLQFRMFVEVSEFRF